MKLFRFCIAFALMLAGLQAYADNTFKLEAHRGISNRYPENTVLSFKKAAAVKHYAGIETDVQMTSDGVLVLMHDDTLDRTTDATGSVSDYTWEQLQKVNIDGGNGWNEKFAGKCKIPTFEEYLDIMAACGKTPYVELKKLTPEGIEKTIRMLHDKGFDGKYVLTSFKKDYLVHAKKFTDAPLEYMKGKISEEYIQACLDNGFIIRPSASKLNKKLVERLHILGLRVEAYGLKVGDIPTQKELKAWGVEGVTCNDWKNLGYDWTYTDATTLTVVNKLLPTKKPWQRLDVEKYPGMTSGEQRQAKCCTGLAVCFNTDSRMIGVRVDYDLASEANGNSSAIDVRGFDLYIEKDGKWMWAENVAPKAVNHVALTHIITKDAPAGPKKCLLYLPAYSQIASLDIVTAKGTKVTPADPGFKGRVCVFGSSYTNCSGCSRPGMGYTAQLTRRTGYNFINMGFSGNSKLQQYFATALLEAPDIDAYVFDGFSNPHAKLIKERLFPFIERFQKEKPGVPLIFMKTVWREGRRFSAAVDKREAAKMDMADSLMKVAVKKYKDVYWVNTTEATNPVHEWTTDGTHPDDYGYYLWAESVKKPIVKILKKYIKK